VKKVICIILMIALVLTSTSTVEAKEHKNRHNGHNDIQSTKDRSESNVFKLKDTQRISYKKYMLPVKPITKGMGAKVYYKSSTGEVKIVKGEVTIVINFKQQTVTVNGVVDNNSGIFTSKESKRTIVLIKYIARLLGAIVDQDDDDIIVTVPGLNAPSNILITTVGAVVKNNTLNSTTQYITATAKITPGQATGGRAELYVGSKLVATDTAISSNDNYVIFSTSDGSPTNEELRSIIPNGGLVTIRLYNANNISVISSNDNLTLAVDYITPTIGNILSANYDSGSGQLTINVTGATANGDFVDVTKLSLMDTVTGRSYQLTNVSKTGSTGIVVNGNQLVVTVGTVDKLGIAGLGSGPLYLTILPGALLSDTAGNLSIVATAPVTLPITYQYTLSAPTNVTVTPIGTTTLQNTLNTSTIFMNASAKIIPGQATGGRAELFVGSVLVAYDNSILATDDYVTFTTSDNAPTNAKLQAAVPVGGVVTVKLYSADGKSAVSAVGNPTLTVDYNAPTITGITSAIYDRRNNLVYLNVTGVSAIGDILDVTKLVFYDSSTNKSYQLTNASGSGSKGTVNNPYTITINLGSSDRFGLYGFGEATVYLTVNGGALLKDAAGNEANYYPTTGQIPVTVIK
jgi:hypothetical protein